MNMTTFSNQLADLGYTLNAETGNLTTEQPTHTETWRKKQAPKQSFTAPAIPDGTDGDSAAGKHQRYEACTRFPVGIYGLTRQTRHSRCSP